jgi:hypothetical protein
MLHGYPGLFASAIFDLSFVGSASARHFLSVAEMSDLVDLLVLRRTNLD